MERDPSKLEWMYSGPQGLVEREDYLLGRSVDKAFRYLDEAEKGNKEFSFADEVEKDLTPLSIFDPKYSTGPIDVINKIKEDPLYQIQKKEEENFKQLLKNPVKMKELEQMAKQHEVNKKKKKNKDRSRSRSRSRSSERKKHKSHKKNKKKERERSRSRSKSPAERYNKRRDYQHPQRPQSSSSSSYDRRDRDRRDSDKHYRKRSRSPPPPPSRDRYRRDNNSSSSHSNEKSSNQYSNYNNNRATSTSNQSKQIDEEERQRKLDEMMGNAKWRDEQRTTRVNKYREEQQKEEEDGKVEHDPEFIRKHLVEAAESGTLEKRIKSNSYNIQRSKFAMDSNFARR